MSCHDLMMPPRSRKYKINPRVQTCSPTTCPSSGDSATRTHWSVHAACLVGPSTLHAASSCSRKQRTEKLFAGSVLIWGGDLAVVLKAFLTNMTLQFAQQHPQENFNLAWIRLQDMVKEGDYIWVSGNRIQADVSYWRHLEPNNVTASWDNSSAGQDCVAIVPQRRI